MNARNNIQRGMGETLEHKICNCGNKSWPGVHEHWCEWVNWGQKVADALDLSPKAPQPEDHK